MADNTTKRTRLPGAEEVGLEVPAPAKAGKVGFSTLSKVDPERPESWEPLFLTFDIDWACDEVLSDSIDLVEQAGVAATWFVTHETALLERLRANTRFELGIHPNFNFLLEGKADAGATAAEVLDRILAIVPEARASRSHSLTQSSRLQQLLRKRGLTHESNIHIPESTGIALRPFVASCGLTRVPYCWADEGAGTGGQSDDFCDISRRIGLVVLDFHPIHVFLNTEHPDRYERTRHLHREPAELLKHRYAGEGTRTRLIKLLKLAGSLGADQA